jgi:hypothetical protein
VALVVFAVTQFLTARRERAGLLVPKLEELYLALNQLTEENGTVCALGLRAIDGDVNAGGKLRDMSELDVYGHRIGKKIIMYIRLYFPKLGPIHQQVFGAQRKAHDLLYQIKVGHIPAMEDMLRAAGMVAHLVRLMEREIVNNRDSLIGDRLWRPRYRSTTPEELAAVPPIPVEAWVTKPDAIKAK